MAPRAKPSSGFELVEHTADVGIKVWGKDLPRMFEAAATGLFSLITDLNEVHPSRARKIEIHADTKEELLAEWLEMLNNLHQIKHAFYSKFDVKIKSGYLEAQIRGERIDPKRHELRTEVKGITWHDLKVEKTERGYEAYVLLDI